MTDLTLIIPLLIILAAALVAALFGRPSLNRRLNITQLSWLLALAPFSAFVILLLQLPALSDGPLIWQIPWMPDLGMNVGLYFDGLSALFALIILGIGTLIIFYTGYYFKGDQSAWAFLCYMVLFMFSMLGVVMAGDIISLFIFWEGTSITSFLLIGYKYKDPAARHGAFKALFITGGGGIALLAGLLFISAITGSTDLSAILTSGEALRASPFYLVTLALVAIGGLTKSAQFPFHIWLPDAMTAPTPASAYLHSATMVKAGIYLMARFNPVLGQTEAWFWILTLFGMVTMLTGAYLGVKQFDLKALLAYSTISQLGVLMMLIGQDTEIAFKALVIGVLAHALYKSALFLIAGIVDHETGTRDLRRLGGLRRAMPFTFLVVVVAGLSMAGLPPLFGFLAKETLLATAVHPSIPLALSFVLPTTAVIAGALLLVQAAMLVWDGFMGPPKDPTIHAHEAPTGMILAPAIPAFLGLSLGVLPEPVAVVTLLADAAAAAYGAPVGVSLHLWTGLNIPLLLSIVAISLGAGLFIFRARVQALQALTGERLTFNAAFAGLLQAIDNGAYWATRLQHGRLRGYLVVILLGTIFLVLFFGGLPLPAAVVFLTPPPLDISGGLALLRIFSLVATVGAAIASVVMNRDIFAILALGACGLSIAVLMVLEPAPDVALVQIVVDILAVVILVLALTRLPRSQRQRAQEFAIIQTPVDLVRDALVALGSGIVVTVITLQALATRPRQSVPTPFFEANAEPLTGALDIVGAIIVDFRALDTLLEITVFSVAGLGIYTLLLFAARKFGEQQEMLGELPAPTSRLLHSYGIGGTRPSSFIYALAYASLPSAIIIATTHMMYGHDQPGDGFTAAIIISLAVGFWYVVFGYHETRRRLGWLQGAPLIVGGIMLAIVSGTVAVFFTGSFLGPVDFGYMLGLPLPAGFHLGTAFLFEVAICLSVLGSAIYMLNTLGHPGYEDPETSRKLEDIEVPEDQEALAGSGSGYQPTPPEPEPALEEVGMWSED